MVIKKINKGYILIIIGVLLVSYQYLSEREKITKEKNKIEYTLQNEVGHIQKEIDDPYDMILEIPKISLKKGIYPKEDPRNNINQNVTIHLSSNYPDSENSNLILMAHSGIGEKAFFQELSQLDQDSLIKIYYHKKLYTYQIDHYYEISKTGTAKIVRDSSKKTVTLITCSQKDKTKQLIYIGYLLDETTLS